MKKLFALSILFLISCTALGHGPTRQQTEESIVIDAAPDKVWQLVGDFSALHKWHPAVKNSEMKQDDVRLLILGEGVTVTEKLVKLDNDAMKFKYKIIDMSTTDTFEFAGRQVEKKTLPVNTYSSTLKVEPEGTGSKVTWKGKFYRAYLLNPPVPEGMSDTDAVNTMSSVYKGGLENLKAMMEK